MSRAGQSIITNKKVRKDYADRVRQKAKDKGTSVNAILKKALDEFMGK